MVCFKLVDSISYLQNNLYPGPVTSTQYIVLFPKVKIKNEEVICSHLKSL